MAGDRIICHCKNVSYIDIRKAMIQGARTLDEIKDMIDRRRVLADEIKNLDDEFEKIEKVESVLGKSEEEARQH